MKVTTAHAIQGSPTRRFTLALLAGAGAVPAIGAAANNNAPRYTLDADGPNVGFTYMLDGTPLTAAMPVTRAVVAIDTSDLSAAQIDVTLDAAAARLGLNFADAALARPDMLDTKVHPTVRFVATEVRTGVKGLAEGQALVVGNLTMRGQTRPLTLTAKIERDATVPTDVPPRTTVQLSGEISRRDFGATGYQGLVGDRIRLDVQAPLRTV